MIKVSLFASAVRPALWPALFKSLEGTSVKIEVVFAGNNPPDENQYSLVLRKNIMNWASQDFTWMNEYIITKNIKPAQCYEIARRHCTGEVVLWIADDCEFPNNVIGKAYDYWKSQNNEKLILSIQTKESGYNLPQGQLFNMKDHCFFGHSPETPLMAPLGMMSRKFLDELGGIDVRYVCGQYENDIVMRAYTKGAKVEIFGDENCYIEIDHLKKSIDIGESTNQEDFLNRPFARGYKQDRKILENSWCKLNQNKLLDLLQSGRNNIKPSEIHDISPVQLDEFQPYPEVISLTHSHSNKGHWE